MRFFRLLAWSFSRRASSSRRSAAPGIGSIASATGRARWPRRARSSFPPHTGIAGIAELLAAARGDPAQAGVRAGGQALRPRHRAEGRRIRIPGRGERDADARHPRQRQDGQAPADDPRGADQQRDRRAGRATRRRWTAIRAGAARRRTAARNLRLQLWRQPPGADRADAARHGARAGPAVERAPPGSAAGQPAARR